MAASLTDFLPRNFPVIQAPMAGVSDSQVVIAASHAGFLGSLGAGMMEPDVMRREIQAIRAATPKPFCVNLFVLDESGDAAPDLGSIPWLTELYEHYNVAFTMPTKFAPSFEAQFTALLEDAPPMASFTFGCLSKEQVAACHARNIYVVGTATSTSEALAWIDVGADAICAQGIEAGGHRGSFLTSAEHGMGLMALLQEIRSETDHPLIAAGGIATGQAVLAALALGADAVQIGTALLPCRDVLLPAPYRSALLKKPFGEKTELTQAFSGRHARGIQNGFLIAGRKQVALPYPLQNAVTQLLRKSSSQTDGETLSLWAGQAVHLVRDVSLADLANGIKAEIKQTAQNLQENWLPCFS
ncbi:NAD(P)H-dependent flavin oxidoreductase [Acetobacter indonesiensis]